MSFVYNLCRVLVLVCEWLPSRQPTLLFCQSGRCVFVVHRESISPWQIHCHPVSEVQSTSGCPLWPWTSKTPIQLCFSCGGLLFLFQLTHGTFHIFFHVSPLPRDFRSGQYHRRTSISSMTTTRPPSQRTCTSASKCRDPTRRWGTSWLP